jgi:hypothetical protein
MGRQGVIGGVPREIFKPYACTSDVLVCAAGIYAPWRRMNMRRLLVVVTGVFMGFGCASQPQPIQTAPVPRPIVKPTPPPRKATMAVLPVEKLLVPQVADELNNRLGKASVAGVSDTKVETVSMEVALMQLDCALPSNACYAQIAKRFEADRLLWAEIEHNATGKRSRKKKAPSPTTIRVVLFDAEHASVLGKAEETFPLAVSNDDLDRLIGRAIAPPVTPPRAAP